MEPMPGGEFHRFLGPFLGRNLKSRPRNGAGMFWGSTPAETTFFSSLDTDHYLCWFLQVPESQMLHDEIMYVLCHLRVLEPPVFASLHRV